MKVSLDWLNSDYVDLSDLSHEQVAEKLTMGAFEVEEVTVHGSDLEGPVVVGEILEIHQHPNADKIRLTRTRVKAGDEPLDIVCGAQNIEVGQIIPVALPGAKVVNRHDGSPLPIKASAIRGVKSNGMLCSAAELGIACDDKFGEGILVLADKDSPKKSGFTLGADARELLQIKPDHIMHVEPRSNRGDALCVAGLAREIAALFNRPLKQPTWNLEQYENKEAKVGTINSVKLENEEDCPFFSLIPIKGVKVGPSIPEISKRLEAIGVRPVNNVVDITNYVMHELGQPLHAYDAAKLSGSSMGVRRARAGEKLTTLDEKVRELTPEVMLIVDDDTAIGVAGIMGGKDSEISDSTTDIYLEAACFSQAVVRRGSRLLGLSSDASLRFERRVDVASVFYAARRAAYLIAHYCGASGPAQVGKAMMAGSDKVSDVFLTLRLSAVKRLLDIEVTAERVRELLSPLGFKVEAGESGQLKIAVPSFRQADVTREIDLIEEICRLNGYDAIAATMPKGIVCRQAKDDTLVKAQSALVGMGLSEAWCSSLVPASENGINEDYLVQVLNPLSKDHQYLRQSLVPGLVHALAHNLDRGQKKVALFESGRVYFKDWEEPAPDNKADNRQERSAKLFAKEINRLAAIICQADKQSSEKADFYTMKGVLENLLSGLAISLAADKVNWQAASVPGLHPFRCAALALNRPPKKGSDHSDKVGIFGNPMVLGYVGQIHPSYAHAMGIKEEAFVFEIDLDRIGAERKAAKFSEIANTPSMVRDLTIDFSKEVLEKQNDINHQNIVRLIMRSGSKNLVDVQLVSVYQSEGAAHTYRLTFQNPSETLTGEEVDNLVKEVKSQLTKQLNASFRA